MGLVETLEPPAHKQPVLFFLFGTPVVFLFFFFLGRQGLASWPHRCLLATSLPFTPIRWSSPLAYVCYPQSSNPLFWLVENRSAGTCWSFCWNLLELLYLKKIGWHQWERTVLWHTPRVQSWPGWHNFLFLLCYSYFLKQIRNRHPLWKNLCVVLVGRFYGHTPGMWAEAVR